MADIAVGGPEAPRGDTTGYLFVLPLTESPPMSVDWTPPASGLIDLMWVDKDGLTLKSSLDSDMLQDWNLDDVLQVKKGASGELSTKVFGWGVNQARAVYGSGNVEGTDDGFSVTFTGELPEHVWVIAKLAGRNGRALLVAEGQVSQPGDVNFKKDEAITHQIDFKLFKSTKTANALGSAGYWKIYDAAPAAVTPPVDPTPEPTPEPTPTPEPAPTPLPATPLSTMWSLTPGLYSSSQNTFDMLEGGQLTSGLSYKRDPLTGPYLDKVGTGIQIASKAGLPDLAQHSFRFYFMYPTLPGSGSTQLLSPMGIVGGALNPVYRLVVTFAGAWRVHDSANAQKVFGTKNLVAGTRYRMEGQATATSISIRIFEGDSDVVWNEASGSALTLGTVQVWRAGQLTSTPEFPLNISRLQLRNDLSWIGPAAAPVAVDSTRDRVLILGDSLTAMNGANGTGGSLAGRPILDGLQQRRFPLQNVVHYGVGGKKAAAVADSLGRVPSQTIADAKAVLGAIDHAVIALGTNDSPSTDAEITAAVNQVIADLKAAGVPRVTWIGAVFEAAGSATATRLNGLISVALSSATGITARFINPDPLIHNGRSETGWWIGDGTHMTPTGYTAARAPIYVDAIAPKA